MFLTVLPPKSKARGKRSKTTSMPIEVARWIVENSQLAPRDAKRIKTLNAKVHDETITPQEARELDAILDVCLQGDILRARAMAALMKQRPSRN